MYEEMLTKIKSVGKDISNPGMILVYLDQLGIIRLKDEHYLQIIYKRRFHTWANLKEPKTFQEKLCYLKLYNRDKRYTQMVDKYAVREYIAEKIGAKYLIPMIGIYDNVDEINFEDLPNQFVMQCTHDSASTIVCTDKTKLNIEKAKKMMKRKLRKNYYYKDREWVYKDVQPRIIIKQYMKDETESELKDYKILCFNGDPKFIGVHFDRSTKHRCNYYTTDWKFLDIKIQTPNDKNKKIERPGSLHEMLEIAKKLSKDIPFLGVDLYEINGKVYFGELTFFPGAGHADMCPKETERIWGDLIKLKN